MAYALTRHGADITPSFFGSLGLASSVRVLSPNQGPREEQRGQEKLGLHPLLSGFLWKLLGAEDPSVSRHIDAMASSVEANRILEGSRGIATRSQVQDQELVFLLADCTWCAATGHRTKNANCLRVPSLACERQLHVMFWTEFGR